MTVPFRHHGIEEGQFPRDRGVLSTQNNPCTEHHPASCLPSAHWATLAPGLRGHHLPHCSCSFRLAVASGSCSAPRLRPCLFLALCSLLTSCSLFSLRIWRQALLPWLARWRHLPFRKETADRAPPSPRAGPEPRGKGRSVPPQGSPREREEDDVQGEMTGMNGTDLCFSLECLGL